MAEPDRLVELGGAQLVAGDYNGDGKTDLATFWDVGNCTVSLYVHPSTGSAFQQGELRYTSPAGAWCASDSELLVN